MYFYKDTGQIEYYLKKFHILEMFENPEHYHPDFTMAQIRKRESIDYKEYPNKLFFMLEGQLKVYSNLSNGKKLLLYFGRKFEIMGDLEFLQIKNHYVTVEATKDITCLVLDVRGNRDKLMKDTVFLKALLYQIGEKLAKSSSNIAINMLWPVENRLSSFISFMAQQDPRSGRRYFEESLTETAEVLGTSYRQLSRVLKIFCTQGILEKNSKRYYILDEEQLTALSGDIYM